MISQLEKQIAFRYLKTKKGWVFKCHFNFFLYRNFSLGVAVLIIVMSVMNGFRSELVDKIVGFNSHITIQSNDIKNDLRSAKTKKIQELSLNILESSQGEKLVLINKNFTKGLSLRGYNESDFKNLKIFKDVDFQVNSEIFKIKYP